MATPKPGLGPTPYRPGEVPPGGEPDFPGGDQGHPYNPNTGDDEDSGKGGRKPRFLRLYGGRGYAGKGSDEVNAPDQMGARGPRSDAGPQDNLRGDTVPPTPGQSASPASATGQGMWKALWAKIAARRAARSSPPSPSPSSSSKSVSRPVTGSR